MEPLDNLYTELKFLQERIRNLENAKRIVDETKRFFNKWVTTNYPNIEDTPEADSTFTLALGIALPEIPTDDDIFDTGSAYFVKQLDSLFSKLDGEVQFRVRPQCNFVKLDDDECDYKFIMRCRIRVPECTSRDVDLIHASEMCKQIGVDTVHTISTSDIQPGIETEVSGSKLFSDGYIDY